MRKLLWIAVTVFAVGAAAPVLAGYAGSKRVLVTNANTSLHAIGGLRAAREADNTVEYIGCQRMRYADSPASALCQARDANRNYLSCRTSDPEMLAVIDGVGTASYISFGVVSGSSECSYVVVNTTSYNM